MVCMCSHGGNVRVRGRRAITWRACAHMGVQCVYVDVVQSHGVHGLTWCPIRICRRRGIAVCFMHVSWARFRMRVCQRHGIAVARLVRTCLAWASVVPSPMTPTPFKSSCFVLDVI